MCQPILIIKSLLQGGCSPLICCIVYKPTLPSIIVQDFSGILCILINLKHLKIGKLYLGKKKSTFSVNLFYKQFTFCRRDMRIYRVNGLLIIIMFFVVYNIYTFIVFLLPQSWILNNWVQTICIYIIFFNFMR